MKVIRNNQRFLTETDWLKSRHSFSFGHHYDPTNMGFGALRVINDDFILPNSGFPPHPHRDMEIITIVEHGTLTHIDSMGNRGEIKSGEVQVMSAGVGIEHAEFNSDKSESLELFQIWLEPAGRNLKPRYDQKKFTFIDNSQTLIVDHIHFAQDSGALGIYQNAKIWYGKYSHRHETDLIISPSRLAYIFIIEGQISIGEYILNLRDAIAISTPAEYDLEIQANTKFLLFDIPV